MLSAVAEIKIRNFHDRVSFSCDADKTSTVGMKRLQKARLYVFNLRIGNSLHKCLISS